MNDNKITQTELFETFPDVMTVHQVRDALGIGRTAVYRLLESGAIRCFKIGNAYKIPKTSLIDYIQRSCGEGGAVR